MTHRRQLLESFDRLPKTRILKNGLTIVHIPRPQDARFYLGVTIAAGARYEDDATRGAAHFLEHMMFRGSRQYPTFKQLSRAFEWLGGEWNAATGYEHTEYWFSGNHQNWQKVVELFADFFCYPKLNDLEVERDVIRRELQKETNEYGLNTDLDFQTFAQIWPNSNLSRPILGELEQVGKMRKKAIKEYRDKFYIPSRMVICVVGGLVEEPIIDQLEFAFSHYRNRHQNYKYSLPKLPKFKGPAIKWLEHSDNEYHIQLSFVCGPEWGPNAQAISLIARILSDGYYSRLGERLRETLGLVYTIDAQPNLFSDNGTLDITASVGPGELVTFFKELFKILKKLKMTGATKSEVERAKTRTLMDLELIPSEPELIGFRWSWALLNSRQPSLLKTADLLKAITTESLNKVVRETLSLNQASLVILGPNDGKLQKSINELFLKFEL